MTDAQTATSGRSRADPCFDEASTNEILHTPWVVQSPQCTVCRPECLVPSAPPHPIEPKCQNSHGWLKRKARFQQYPIQRSEDACRTLNRWINFCSQLGACPRWSVHFTSPSVTRYCIDRQEAAVEHFVLSASETFVKNWRHPLPHPELQR